MFVLLVAAFVLAIEETMVPHPGGPSRARKSLVMGCLRMACRYCVCFLRL